MRHQSLCSVQNHAVAGEAHQLTDQKRFGLQGITCSVNKLHRVDRFIRTLVLGREQRFDSEAMCFLLDFRQMRKKRSRAISNLDWKSKASLVQRDTNSIKMLLAFFQK